MTKPFHSPRLTLIRAQHHIDEFKSIVMRFRDEKPWSYFTDDQSEPGKVLHKVKFTRDLPEMLPCILFDVANNLRAVLDQAGYAAALVSGKITPAHQRPRTNFPFADTLLNLNNHIDNRGGCSDLPPEITAVFRGFKPYKTGNHTLWTLHQICNAKKHCRLVPVEISNAVGTFYGNLPPDSLLGNIVDPATGEVVGWDAAKRELTLVSVPAGTKCRISGNFAFLVTIDQFTENEMRVAAECASDGSRRYRILYVPFVADPTKWRVMELPNPIAEAGRGLFRVVGTSSTRMRFEPKQ
jgi:hypothetical protein